MLISFDQQKPICFQQKTASGGAFNGTLVGYGILAYSAGGGVGRFRAREQKLLATNELQIALINLGVLTPKTTVKNQNGKVFVYLKRSSSAITALLSEVATALDNFRDENGKGSPILLGVSTDATATAVSLTALVGGLDFTVDNGIVKATVTSTTNAGLFFFNNPRPLAVIQIEAVYPGTEKVEIVSVDRGLNTSDPTDITGLLTTGIFLGGSSRPIIIAPTQALVFSNGSAGVGFVRVWCQLPE